MASVGVTPEELGTMLYDSVQRKLMGLPDEVRVFPAHGAGSACGKNLSTERWSTIGSERLVNYACRPMRSDEFVAIVTEGQPPAPDYFGYDAMLNRRQRATYAAEQVTALDPDEVMAAVAAGAVLLDARETADFGAGHLPASLSIPLGGRFAETAGMLLDPDDRVVVIAPDGHEREVVTRLARIGFDHVVGYLPRVEAVLVTLPDEDVAHASRLTPAAFDKERADLGADLVVVDVRNAAEAQDGMVPGAINIPLAELRRRIEEIPRTGPVILHCAGGWRSAVAASYLRSQGYPDVSDILGGDQAWEAERAASA
jgi:rhodanese-related sulfurtransferase